MIRDDGGGLAPGWRRVRPVGGHPLSQTAKTMLPKLRIILVAMLATCAVVLALSAVGHWRWIGLSASADVEIADAIASVIVCLLFAPTAIQPVHQTVHRVFRENHESLFLLVGPAGLEPATRPL